MKTLWCLLLVFVIKENTKFHLDVSEQKNAISPIQVHDLHGFLPQAPGEWGRGGVPWGLVRLPYSKGWERIWPKFIT